MLKKIFNNADEFDKALQEIDEELSKDDKFLADREHLSIGL